MSKTTSIGHQHVEVNKNKSNKRSMHLLAGFLGAVSACAGSIAAGQATHSALPGRGQTGTFRKLA